MNKHTKSNIAIDQLLKGVKKSCSNKNFVALRYYVHLLLLFRDADIIKESDLIKKVFFTSDLIYTKIVLSSVLTLFAYFA